jgi:tetratricopeptide (TPR) repeat protein
MKGLDAAGDPIALFGGEASPVITQLLQDAAAVYQQTNRAEAILWSAQAIDPACLPVYFALYKFYFYKFRLEDAEKVALMGLKAAAKLGGFPSDWWRLSVYDANWDSAADAQHFYLFSLKALAFIRLRLGKREESLALLDKLKELDPKDSVGSSVIRDLANELI